MIQVTALPILCFLLLQTIPMSAAIVVAWLGYPHFVGMPFGEMLLLLLALAVFLVVGTIVYRVFIAVFPLPVGEIKPKSRDEFAYTVYVLFWLLIYTPLSRAQLFPTPMSALVLTALGARVGKNSYSAGIVFDPQFVSIGSNSQCGLDCLLVPHASEGSSLSHFPIRIGNNVTIGGRAVILAGVSIDDGAIVAVGAVVSKGTHIGANEVWGGIPAKCLKKRGGNDPIMPKR